MIVVAFGLLILDFHAVRFHQLRTKVTNTLVFPFEYLVDAPIRVVRWVSTSITAQQALLDENAQLRARELLLQAKLQRLISLQKENKQLRLLLQSTQQLSEKVGVARLISVDTNPNVLQVMINKGEQEGVYEGQPVLDAFGIMGQVIEQSAFTSKVMLITDPRSAVPVEDARNGFRGVAMGQGFSGELKLINLPDKADIKIGDVFITSGLGLRYPAGYPVGQISKITQNDLHHTEFTLQPLAHLDQTEHVLLIWPNHSAEKPHA